MSTEKSVYIASLAAVIFYSNCKINIGLNVLDKRKDGFHNLVSVFYPIPFFDLLEINPSPVFKFTTSGIKIPGQREDNLIIKAHALIKKKFDIEPCHIHLHKMIPMGAGLGGGSSNAAYALIGLNKVFGLGIKREQMLGLAGELGSDCPFFIVNRPSLVRGRGEIIEPVELNLENYWVKIINPGIHVSTKEAFDGISTSNKKSVVPANKINLDSWKGNVTNDFEKTVGCIHPEILRIKNVLYSEGAIYAAMTGTGSSIYGIFQSRPERTMDEYFQKITPLKWPNS